MSSKRGAVVDRLTLALLSAVAILGSACSDTAIKTDLAPEDVIKQIAIEATEYELDAPATTTAGGTEISFVNNGEEPHQLRIALLSDDAPEMSELVELPDEEQQSLLLEQIDKASNPTEPGETFTFTVELPLGRYGMACFLPDEKTGELHANLGMVHTLTVE